MATGGGVGGGGGGGWVGVGIRFKILPSGFCRGWKAANGRKIYRVPLGSGGLKFLSLSGLRFSATMLRLPSARGPHPARLKASQ